MAATCAHHFVSQQASVISTACHRSASTHMCGQVWQVPQFVGYREANRSEAHCNCLAADQARDNVTCISWTSIAAELAGKQVTLSHVSGGPV